mmetsp:Transcript_49933/g.79016  ORF Transcript_49933/g.79016 Transcript_49933/m.79016 type:complete len:89 (+) Transcript_49933:158-424(+)
MTFIVDSSPMSEGTLVHHMLLDASTVFGNICPMPPNIFRPRSVQWLFLRNAWVGVADLTPQHAYTDAKAIRCFRTPNQVFFVAASSFR